MKTHTTHGFPTGLFAATLVGALAGTALSDPPGAACNPADLAPPYGVLNLDDAASFNHFFEIGNLQKADLDGNGLLDLTDINMFVEFYNQGCP
jgi:hypothetical protein